jgi:hypothetical protein
MAKILLVLVLLLSFSGAAFSAMYKWVDKEGHVHYGDCPPPDCKSEQIETAPGPSKEETQRSRERTERLMQEQKQSEAVRKEKRESEQKKVEETEVARKKKCKDFNSKIYLLKQPGTISFTDDEGNIIRPSDKQREKMISDMEAFLKENCQ